MFYILPTIGQCLHCCQKETAHPIDRKKWNHLEKIGIVLDIFLIAFCVISATCALYTHLGLPSPWFMSLSVNSIAGLYAASFLIILIDSIKCWNRRQNSSLHSATVPEGQKSSSPMLIDSGRPNLPEVSHSTEKSSRLPDGQGSRHISYIDLESSLGADSTSNSSSTAKELSHSREQEITQEDSTAASQSQRYLKKLASNAQDFADEVTTKFKGMLDDIRTPLTPGSIQTRLYVLLLHFMVEHLIAYNEKKQSFDVHLLFPIAYQDKLALLEKKEIEDLELKQFYHQCIEILQSGDHPFEMRCAILQLIETIPLPADVRTPLRPLQVAIVQLCYALFTEFEGITFGRALIHEFIPRLEPIGFQDLEIVIQEDIAALKKLGSEIRGSWVDMAIQEVTGHVGVAFSPMVSHNFPNILWVEEYLTPSGKIHPMQVMRFGSPTSQAVLEATIVNQMIGFVLECARRGETILSFQHQSFQGEAPRLEPMFDLAEHYPGTFFVMCLDMDSPFYQQIRKGVDIDKNQQEIPSTYKAFKAELIAHQKNLKMSSNLKKRFSNATEYERDLNEVADYIRKVSFPELQENSPITIAQKRNFIFLFTAQFTRYMNGVVLPTFSTNQCKDTRDRSMSILAMRYLMNQWELGKENDPETILHFRILTHFVAMIIKGASGGMARTRLNRFQSAIQCFVTPAQKVADRASPRGNHIGRLHSQNIAHTRYDYTYHPYPCDVVRDEHYKQSSWVQPTSQGYRTLFPLIGRQSSPEKLLAKFYRNSKLKFEVRVEDNNSFEIHHDNMVWMHGIYKIENNNLAVSLKAPV